MIDHPVSRRNGLNRPRAPRTRPAAAGAGRIAWLLWAASAAAPAFAQPQDPAGEAAPVAPVPAALPAGESDSNELLLFEDIPVVVSASRSARPLTLTTVPVGVVSSADIHYSGLTSLPEILQFSPGFHTLRLDRNRYATGVRGFQHEFSDRTLFLIDGKSASNVFEGGVDFQRLPLLAEDIERVEIVRGPGGAAWGANAFNGVVNIITKSPEKTLGLFASSTVDQFGDTLSHVRWGAKDGDLAWRLSFGYQSHVASGDAVAHAEGSNDFGRQYIFSGAVVKTLSDQATLTFDLGYSNLVRGSEEFIDLTPERNANSYSVRPSVRFDQKWDADTSMYVRWFGNFDRVDRPGLWKYFAAENDVEAQVNFVAGERHHLSVGGNFRFNVIETDGDEPDLIIGDDMFDEQWAGVFLIDRWEVTDRFTLEGQARADWNSSTEADWSGRLTALYAMDAGKRHVVRLAAAKAFRAPTAAIREFSVLRVPLEPPAPPGLFGVVGLHPGELNNEQTYSLEAGYTATWGHGFSTSTTLAFQRYCDLIGTRIVDDPLGLGRTYFQLDNIDGANGAVFEQSATLAGEEGSLSVWYAYSELRPDQGNAQPIRALLPPEHSAGVTGRLFLGELWTLNSAYRFTGPLAGEGLVADAARATHRLDLTVSRRFAGSRGEFTFGVADVLDSTHDAVYQLGQFTSHDTPGRTFFARLQLQF